MNVLNVIVLFCVTYLAVFAAGYFDTLRTVVGVQLDLLPALMVYCGLSASLTVLTVEAILAGLLFDSLSANPLGVTCLPLFVVGLVVHQKRELILRDEAYAQFVLGAAAGVVVPVLGVLLMVGGGHRPLVGWGSLWQLAVLGLAGGCFTPLCFGFFDRIQRTFGYQPLAETSFRPDREIKRGRA